MKKDGYCPACDSRQSGNEIQVSPKRTENNPWSYISKAYICSICNSKIPGHLWCLWDGWTEAESKLQWQEVFMPKPNNENIQYVNEDGTPIDPSAIDTTNSTFTDEYGRPSDHLGNPINQELTELEAVAVAEKLLQKAPVSEVLSFCVKYVERYPNNESIWKILGCAHGSNQDPAQARLAFLNALEINPLDGLTLSNYITACFDVGDKRSGLNGIEMFFTELDHSNKQIILETLASAWRTGLIKTSELPSVVANRIKKMK
jgi:tetratricopeptide (TPR) repeat protein